MDNDIQCRICLEKVEGEYIIPCNCSSGNFHIDCFLKWINVSQNTHCEVCLGKYNYIQVNKRYNCKAIAIFILSSNCIQSICFFWLYYFFIWCLNFFCY